MLKNNLLLLLVLTFGLTVAIQHTAYATSPAPPSPPVCEFTGEVTNLLDKYQSPIKTGEEASHLEIKVKSVGKQLETGDEFFKDTFKGCAFFVAKSIKAFIASDSVRGIKFKIGDQISGKLAARGYSQETFLTLNGIYNLTILNTPPRGNQKVNNVKLQWWNPISWTRVSTMPVPLVGPACVAIKNKVYVIGGSSQDVNRAEVYYAALNPDGNIGQWTQTSTLPKALYRTAAVGHEKTAYILGGQYTSTSSAVFYSSDVYSASVGPDGGLESWRKTGGLPRALGRVVAAADGKKVYLLGGYDSLQTRREIYLSFFDRKGGLAQWTLAGNLPQPLRSFSSNVFDRKIYVIGGRDDQGQDQRGVYWALVKKDGTIGPWVDAPSLPAPRHVHGSAVAGGQVWVMGGYDGQHTTAGVYVSSINSNGTPNPWRDGPSLPQPRERFCSVVLGNKIFVLGGWDGQAASADVFVISF